MRLDRATADPPAAGRVAREPTPTPARATARRAARRRGRRRGCEAHRSGDRRRPARSRRLARPTTCTTCARTPRSCATSSSASRRCCPTHQRKAFVKHAEGAAGQPRRAPGRRGARRRAARRRPRAAPTSAPTRHDARPRPAQRAARGAGSPHAHEFAERFAAYDTKADTPGSVDDARRPRSASMKVLATYSIKGGVGKTTAAVNLADEAASTGARVLLWDLDPQGAATYFLRVTADVKGGAAAGRPRASSRHIRATDLAGHRRRARPTSRCATSTCTSTTSSNPTERLAALLEPLADALRRRVARLPAVASRWPARACSPPPTRCSCRRSRRRCRSARSTSSSEFLADRPRRRPGGAAVHLDVRPAQAPAPHDRGRAAPPFPASSPTAIPNASVVEQMADHRAPVAAFAAHRRAGHRGARPVGRDRRRSSGPEGPLRDRPQDGGHHFRGGRQNVRRATVGGLTEITR